jgi:hypothetical protein
MYICVCRCVWVRESSSPSPYLICSGRRETSHRQTTDGLVRHPHSRTCFTCLRALSISTGRVRTRSSVAQAWRMPCPRVPDWCAAALDATARERLDAWWRCNDGAARDGPRAFMRVERVLSLAQRGARVGGGDQAIGSVQMGSWLALALSQSVMFSGVWGAEPHRGCVTLSVGHVGAGRCLHLRRSPATICPVGPEQTRDVGGSVGGSV